RSEMSDPGTWLAEVPRICLTASIRSFLRGAVPGVPPDVPAPRALIARYRDTRAAVASHDGLDGSGLPAPTRELLQAVGLLAGDSGDEIEVLVDVEDGEPRGFGCGGDQQVGDGRSA